jgi:hypothetical protein
MYSDGIELDKINPGGIDFDGKIFLAIFLQKESIRLG